jgi:hypothetical protein
MAGRKAIRPGNAFWEKAEWSVEPGVTELRKIDVASGPSFGI